MVKREEDKVSGAEIGFDRYIGLLILAFYQTLGVTIYYNL